MADLAGDPEAASAVLAPAVPAGAAVDPEAPVAPMVARSDQ